MPRNIYYKIDENNTLELENYLTENKIPHRRYDYDPNIIVCEEYAERKLDVDLLSETDEDKINKTNSLSEAIYKDYNEVKIKTTIDIILEKSYDKWIYMNTKKGDVDNE